MSCKRKRWAHIHCDLFDTIPWVCLSNKAFRVAFRVMLWCEDYRRDGVAPNIPEQLIVGWCGSKRSAARIVDELVHAGERILPEGLLTPTDNGFRFNFPPANLYRTTEVAKTEAQKEMERERNKMPRIRNSIIRRDGLICRICGEPVEENDVHVDHVQPIHKGGKTVFTNLRVTHSRCNLTRRYENLN